MADTDIAQAEAPQHVPSFYRYAQSGAVKDVLAANETQRGRPGVPDAVVDLAKMQMTAIGNEAAIVSLTVQGGLLGGGAHPIWTHGVELHLLHGGA